MRHVLAAALLVLTACSADATPSTTPTSAPPPDSSTTSPPTTTTTTPPASTVAPVDRRPPGDLHDPPSPLPDGSPGDVIWVEELPAPGDASAWNVLYLSTSIDGSPIATSGWVARSSVPGPHDVLVFAHGTTGLGDGCAPTVNGSVSPFLFADFLDAGWTVAFTDYQGLGTPGLHHYLVADPTAHSVVDAARAARRLDPDATERLALYGFSQGGHAVLATTERIGDLAPELELTHTVAAAPAVLLREWFEESPPAQRGYLAMISTAYADAYDTPLDLWLGAEAIEIVDDIRQGCLLDIDAALLGLGAGAVVADASPGTVVADLLYANEPATRFFPTPVLLLTGADDRLFTPEVADLLIARMCGLGIGVDHIDYPNASHIEVGSRGRTDALAWIESDTGSADSAC